MPATPAPRRIRLRSFVDERGRLTTDESALPFVPVRTFWVTEVPAGAVRAGHANRTTSEALIAVAGSVTVVTHGPDGLRSDVLDRPDELLLLPPLTWVRCERFSTGAVLLVLADTPFDPADHLDEPAPFDPPPAGG